MTSHTSRSMGGAKGRKGRGGEVGRARSGGEREVRSKGVWREDKRCVVGEREGGRDKTPGQGREGVSQPPPVPPLQLCVSPSGLRCCRGREGEGKGGGGAAFSKSLTSAWSCCAAGVALPSHPLPLPFPSPHLPFPASYASLDLPDCPSFPLLRLC